MLKSIVCSILQFFFQVIIDGASGGNAVSPAHVYDTSIASGRETSLTQDSILEHKVTRISKGINPHSGQITLFGIKFYMDSNYEVSEDGNVNVVT